MRAFLLLALGSSVWTVLGACTARSSDRGSWSGAGEFASDDPRDLQPREDYESPRLPGTGGAPGAWAPVLADVDGALPGPEAAVQEPDLVASAGDRIYVLTRRGWLSAVESTADGDVRLLGRLAFQNETPRALYAREAEVFVLLQERGNYVETDSGSQWVENGRVALIDASDPSRMVETGTVDIPGIPADSRLVGNVLYVVAGGESSLGFGDGITILAIAIGAGGPEIVDSISVRDESTHWLGGGPLATAFFGERIYVAGQQYDPSVDRWGATIMVVDISDPSGKLRRGMDVVVAGAVDTRWHMDEHAGVLRVVSQVSLGPEMLPVVETFLVESVDAITPLGRLVLEGLPAEPLASVRFDGDFAYAASAAGNDVLFTIDLSDPAAPRKLAELPVDARLYHLEPDAMQVVGFGFEADRAIGRLHASLFDSSDPSRPTLIDRVDFGDQWARLVEDPTRSLKSLSALKEEGLVLIPFGGMRDADPADGIDCETQHDALQLIDLAPDGLTLRGTATSRGDVRRTLLDRGDLLTISDDRLQRIDIQDRDRPLLRSYVDFFRNVDITAVWGDHLVRAGVHSASGAVGVDIVPFRDPGSIDALGTVEIPDVFGGGASCRGARLAGLAVEDGIVSLVVHAHADGRTVHAIVTIDASEPTAPVILTRQTLRDVPAAAASDYIEFVNSGETLVAAGSTLVLKRGTAVDVIDLGDPARPGFGSVALPSAEGLTGLHVDDTSVYSSHLEPISGEPGGVRHYLDRIDISDPRSPRLSAAINVPGSLLAWYAPAKRALTMEYRRTASPSDLGMTLHVVRIRDDVAELEASHDLPDDASVLGIALGDDRAFLAVSRPVQDWNYDLSLLVLSGVDSGDLHAEELPLATVSPDEANVRIVASRRRALVVEALGDSAYLVDATDPREPRLARTTSLRAPAQHLTLADEDTAVSASWTEHDIQVFELGD